MMMQHEEFSGTPIANLVGERFVDRMKRIASALLDEMGLVMVNCRLNGAKVPWFALRVWTGKEKAVEKALSDLGITSLVPMRKGPDLRRRHRVIEGALMPVIHGYVLVQMVSKEEYLAGFLGLDYCIAVLGGCDNPMRVTDAEVKRFNALAEAGVYDAEAHVSFTVTAGDRVTMVGGPFEGRDAKVVTPNRKGRGDVVVLVNIMGGEIPMTVPIALLRKL